MEKYILESPPQVEPTFETLNNLYQAYDMIYGLVDADGAGGLSPLSSVTLHEVESSHQTTAIKDRIAQYRDLGIFKRFNVGLTDFLKLPREIVTDIVKIAEEEVIAENKRNAGKNGNGGLSPGDLPDELQQL